MRIHGVLPIRLVFVGSLILLYTSSVRMAPRIVAMTLGVGQIESCGKRPPADGGALLVPFELYGNHILLPVSVNGSAPLRFILDTGAEPTIINNERAGGLGLKFNASSKLSSIKGVSLRLSRVELPDQKIWVAPLDFMERRFGRHFDGILGSALFSRFVVEIDYASKAIRLYEPRRYGPPPGAIAIRLKDGLPYVKATFSQDDGKPIEGEFVIDTGASHAVALTTPFVKAHKLVESAPHTLTSYGWGVDEGEYKQYISRLKEFQLGGFLVKSPIVAFAQATKGDMARSDYAGEIGAEVLHRFDLVLDYSHKLMALKPNEQFGDPFEFNMSGILLTNEGADFTTLKVYRIIDDSPAANAGLLPGDVIQAVDGTPAGDLGAARLQQMLKQEGKDYLLTIKRGEAVINTRIKLRRLI